MNIENAVFRKSSADFKKLVNYGFKKENEKYILGKKFLNDEFSANIIINKDGNISGKVMDLQMNEEYVNIKTDTNGVFVNKVREAYKDILLDIKNHCFNSKYFVSDQANRIVTYIWDKYNREPEFLWERSDGDAVFRRSDNNKWFGIIMTVDKSKLYNSKGLLEIINVKLDADKIQNLLKRKGYYEAYHMNKKYWITIVLDDTLSDDDIEMLINESYNLVK